MNLLTRRTMYDRKIGRAPEFQFIEKARCKWVCRGNLWQDTGLKF